MANVDLEHVGTADLVAELMERCDFAGVLVSLKRGIRNDKLEIRRGEKLPLFEAEWVLAETIEALSKERQVISVELVGRAALRTGP
jgi:hypothetical protein